MPDIKNIVDAFRELDITVGNGLIGESQLLEPARRALFIGLGGTGNHALRRLKRIIHQRYKHIGKCFSFIGIDTDTSSPQLNKEYMLLDESEKIKLVTSEDYFDPRKRDLMPDYMRDWLNDEASYSVRGDGAGGKRAAARALLFNSAETIINKFENDIQAIRKGDPGARIDVFILAGIGGGTGSGTMLDTAYMLRKILGGVAHNLYGFIFMPDINTSIPLPKATKEYIPPNAYAALKEIDYWMNIQSRDDTFRQKYTGGFEVEEKKAPFDYCWPMTATNANGVYVIDAINQASTVAAEIICAWIAFKEGDGGAKDSFIQSFAANVPLMRDMYVNKLASTKKGATRPVSFDYTVCGASVAKLPVAAINTYLACILFRKFSGLYEHAFDDKILSDLPKFCSDPKIAIDYNSIKRAMESQYASLGLRIPDMSNSSHSDLFENDAERSYIFNLNKVSENAEAVKAKIVQDKKNILEMAFREIFLDPGKGPYYLDAFIQNGNTGLIALIGSFKRNIATEKARLANLETDAERDKNDKYRNGKKAWGLMKGNHVREYSAALTRYYSLKRDEILCDACSEIYTELQDQLQKKVSASYKATFGILDALSGTFKTNIKTFDSSVKVEKKDTVTQYSWDIFTMPDIVNLVMTTLASKGIDDEKQTELLQDFLADLLDFIDKDIKRNSALSDWNDSSIQLDINGFLADFVTNKFSDLTKKTLKEYMEIIAQKDGLTLNEYLVRQFKRMEQDSSPLFNKPPAGGTSLYYGTIPLGDSDIKDAWDDYALGDKNRTAYPSVSTDTLVFITVGCGVPLYAAKQLEDAETAYNAMMENASTNSAMRLVSTTKMSREKGHRDETWDWRYFPPVIPTDERTEGSLRAKERELEAARKVEVDRLLGKNILRCNPAAGKCLYTRLTKDNKMMDFDILNKAIFAHKEVSSDVPVADLNKYKNDLTEIRSYIDGTEKPAIGIGQRFNVFFEVAENSFNAAVHNDWDDIYHEVVTVYLRSLNIRRDLAEIEKFYDMVAEKIAAVDGVLKGINAAGEMAEQIVKGFLCGIFATNGRQWQHIQKDGETIILARGMGADKYPIFAMYENFVKQDELQEELARIKETYAKALDDDDFKLDGYKIFIEHLKNEHKQITADANASDAQRYVINQINDFATGLVKSLGI